MDSGWAVLAGVIATFLGTSVVPFAVEAWKRRNEARSAERALRIEVVADWILALQTSSRGSATQREREVTDRQAVRLLMLLEPQDAALRRYIDLAHSWGKPQDFAYAFGQWARGGGFDQSIIEGGSQARSIREGEG